MDNRSLKEKTFSGMKWSALDKIFQNIFIFISGVLLARTLNKSDYGLLGVLMIFVSLANLLQDSGFSTALIRKKDVTETDYSTVFYSNICVSIFIYILFFFVFPLFVSDEKSILTPLSRFLFLSFLFNSFSSVQNTRLVKSLNYKLITKINFFAVFVSYGFALIMAFTGYGVWALASQIVILSFLKMISLWMFAKWRPTKQFSKVSFNNLFSFSSKLLLGSALNSIMVNIPQNIIGKCYSLGITGIYNQASRQFNSVNELLTGMHSVSFPVLSTVNGDDLLKKAIRKFVRIKAIMVFPVFMGLALVAVPFMQLLGEDGKWADAAPVLQLLCVSGFFLGLESVNGDILRIKGKSGTILNLTIFHTVLMAITLIIPLILGLGYIYYVGAISATYVVRYFTSCYISNRLIGYKFIELLKDLYPYLIISSFCVGCGYLLTFLISDYLFLLISQIVAVALLYVGILYLSGSKVFREAIELALGRYKK